MNTRKTTKGFTIIEVVLVLAIAGLIFLMVFVALPALQRGQRDTARKNDVSSIASAVTQYISNNKGKFPSTSQLTSYTSDSVSTNTTSVTVGTKGATTVSVTQGQAVVIQSAKCDSTGADSGGTAKQTLSAGTANQFVVVTYVEAGGGSSFCQDS